MLKKDPILLALKKHRAFKLSELKRLGASALKLRRMTEAGLMHSVWSGIVFNLDRFYPGRSLAKVGSRLVHLALLIVGIPSLVGGYPLTVAGDVNLRLLFQVLGIVTFFWLLRKEYFQEFLKLSDANEQRISRVIRFFLVFIFVKSAWLSWFSFSFHGIDFSIFDLVFPNTAEGRFMRSAACGDCDLFGQHSMPFLLLILPLHRIFDHPLFLVTLHAIVLASASWPWDRLIRSSGLIAPGRVLANLVFLLSTLTASILSYGFHIEVFYVPLFLWLFVFVQEKRWRAFLFTALITLTIKEDAAFYLIGFSLSIVLFRQAPVRIAIQLLGLCGLSLFINFYWIMPSHHPSGTLQIIGTASRYGKSLPEIVDGLARDWLAVSKSIATGSWLRVLMPYLFLPLGSPGFLVSNAPFVLIHSTAAALPMKQLALYYGAPYLPWVLAAWLEVIGRLKSAWQVRCVVVTLALLLFVGPSYRLPVPHSDVESLRKAVARIREDSTVCAQGVLFPHLPYYKRLRILNVRLIEEIPSPCDVFLTHPGLNPYPESGAEIVRWTMILASRRDLRGTQIGGVQLFERVP